MVSSPAAVAAAAPLCGVFRCPCFCPRTRYCAQLKGQTVQMTNLEWYKFIYPDNDDLPYMYNEFSWSHCA